MTFNIINKYKVKYTNCLILPKLLLSLSSFSLPILICPISVLLNKSEIQ